jgi:KUP system potassium uptake protein
VVLEKVLSKSNVLSFWDKFIMDYYFILKKFSLSEERGFGLDVSFVTIERVPLMISYQDTSELTRLT